MPLKHITEEKIITGFISAITLTFFFPPFESISPYGGSNSEGYRFILLPPDGRFGTAVINTDMLIVEWGFVLMLATAAWLLIKIRERQV